MTTPPPQEWPIGRLDHVAIVVPDTEAALAVWRDLLGFPLKFSQVVQEGAVRLTHLELGNTDLQLVEPLVPDHPLQAWLAERGVALHHLCFEVDDVDGAFTADSPYPIAAVGDCPHEGTQGRQAIFLDNADTSVVIELSTAP
ncbi:MAG: VOC family protein [Actinomycetota bacterium]